VKAQLERKIRESGMQDAFGQILLPTEKIMSVIRGKRQVVERTLLPGYLLIEMQLNDETWNLVRSLPTVARFVSDAQSPAVVPEKEILQILKRVEEAKTAVRPPVALKVGEHIRVIEGPFRDFTGTIEAVKPEASRLRVSLSVFGRPTPVELDILQVEAA
jgi:transcriptional antiterminator NusG